MAAISIKQRAQAISRARTALTHLERNPNTSRNTLGAARDQLNIVQNWRDVLPVNDAVYALEAMVLSVYGRIPTETN